MDTVIQINEDELCKIANIYGQRLEDYGERLVGQYHAEGEYNALSCEQKWNMMGIPRRIVKSNSLV